MTLERARHILYITLEYCQADLFSGNGVCARSQVRGLLSNNVQVHTICARPRGAHGAEPIKQGERLTVVEVDVWQTTDRASAHEAFAGAAATVLEGLNWAEVDACLAVDWTGMNAVRSMSEMARRQVHEHGVVVMYLNFRCYVSMTGISDDDRAFYREAETAAVHIATMSGGASIALSTTDADTLRGLALRNEDENDGGEGSGTGDGDETRVHVLLPMLREELATIAREQRVWLLDTARTRRFLVCAVRLSDDKGAHRFVQLVKQLRRQHNALWRASGVVPLLCGAASQGKYAARVREMLREAVEEAVIVDRFLPPRELAAVFGDSVLNVHPALYEAYGMTIVEAAAVGCPSVIHCCGIGAEQLLPREEEAVVVADFCNVEACANVVAEVLRDNERRQHVARNAFDRAIKWTEEEHVDALLRVVDGCLSRRRSSR